uniref:Putative tick transposon n=1 Tax=Rhipicephalus pulchellus TaxID=72859 RepID=L7LSC4_RHIPC
MHSSVVGVTYFHNLMCVILNVLCSHIHSPFKPYRVVDYFKRIEFQRWGSPHAHILLWLENAPDEIISPNIPETIRLATHLVSLGTSLWPRLRTKVHQHTYCCYKRGNTRCGLALLSDPLESPRGCFLIRPHKTMSKPRDA